MFYISFICKCMNKFFKVKNLIPLFGYFIIVFFNVRRVLSFQRVPINISFLVRYRFRLLH